MIAVGLSCFEILFGADQSCNTEEPPVKSSWTLEPQTVMVVPFRSLRSHECELSFVRKVSKLLTSVSGNARGSHVDAGCAVGVLSSIMSSFCRKGRVNNSKVEQKKATRSVAIIC